MIALDRKAKFALLSILSNTLLIIFKITAGVLSGSVSIISEAIHSMMDLAASFVAFLSVRSSAKPADDDHPYGHGKVENISGVVEGLLIFVAAGMIIHEAVLKLFQPAELEYAFVAAIVMAVSALINFGVSRRLYQVAREEDSMALEADALHLKTDVYTSAGVGLGIMAIHFTGLMILDSVIAIFVSLLIIKEAWVLCKNGLNHLLDVRLTDEEEAEIDKVIKTVIEANPHRLIDYHKLKTRKSGHMRHIDFHITVDPELTVREAHEIVGSLKRAMNETFANTRVSIHIDPFEAKNKS